MCSLLTVSPFVKCISKEEEKLFKTSAKSFSLTMHSILESAILHVLYFRKRYTRCMGKWQSCGNNGKYKLVLSLMLCLYWDLGIVCHK